MNDHTHSLDCSGVHIGASCLAKDDVRGAIVRLMSLMLDNPDKDGIYPTTMFYDRMEAFISSSQALARRSAIEEAMRVVEKAKKGIDYDNNPISNFGHILTNLILEALQEKLDTEGV